MPSVGELWIGLGFDVNDAKLKDFNKNITSTYETMLKLGAASVATLGSMTLVARGIADHANKLEMMSQMWGVSKRAAQEYALVVNSIASDVSLEAGQEQYRAFSELIRAGLPVGSGNAATIARLGGDYQAGDTPEMVLKNILQNLPNLRGNFGSSKQSQDALISSLASGIGLPNLVNYLDATQEQRESASNRALPDDAVQKLSKLSQSFSGLEQSLTTLMNTLNYGVADDLREILDKLTSIIDALTNFSKEHPNIAAGAAAGGGVVATIGGYKTLKWLLSGFGGAAEGAAGAASTIGGFSMAGIAAIGALAASPWIIDEHKKEIADWLQGNDIAPKMSEKEKSAQSDDALMEQYRKDAEDDPLNFMLDEATRQAAEKNISNNVNVNINSTAPAKELADEFDKLLQKRFDYTGAQTNLDGGY